MEPKSTQDPLLDGKPTVVIEQAHTERFKWKNNLDYLLSLIGYGIGLGKIWRFPYICATNGGAVFLIPYILSLVILVFPVTYLESSLGQFSGKSAYNVWDICPLFRGIGMSMLCISTLFCLYYHAVMNWILYYLVLSFSNPLPWTTCNNWWNTDSCFSFDETNSSIYLNISALNSTSTFDFYNTQSLQSEINVSSQTVKRSTASEEFWNNNLLRISNGIDDIGSLNWHLVTAMAVGCLIIFLCIIRGIKSIGKVVYVTTTVPFLLITIILIRAVMLPGAIKGIQYYMVPEFYKLLDLQVWIRAFLQIFYSMGIGWGGFINMASYNRFDNNFHRDAILYSIVGEGTSIYAGFVVFSVLGFMSLKTGLEITDILRTGPGLAFITYPEALSQLPLPQIWTIMFFLMLSLIALTSLFVNVEVCVTTIADLIPSVTRRKRVLVTLSTCLFMFSIALVFTSQGGIYVFQLIDWYIGAVCIYIIVIIECVIIGWIYGTDRYLSDLQMMLGKRPSKIFHYLWRYLIPFVLTLVLIVTMIKYQLPTYGSYTFPPYTTGIGWFIALVTVIPVPIWIISEISQHEGSIIKKIKLSLKPNSKWGSFKKDLTTNSVESKV